MKKNILKLLVTLIPLFFLSNTHARPIISFNGGLYDFQLGILMPNDGNLAHARNFEQEFQDHGFMVLRDAIKFIDELNDNAYLGQTNWRLPTTNELSHLYSVDGVGYVYNSRYRGLPFENLQAYYWAEGGRSYDMAHGREVNFAAYRFVLPVASKKFDFRAIQIPRQINRINKSLYQSFPFFRSP